MIYNLLFENLVGVMDDEIRESIHDKYAPCSDAFFLAKYIEADDNFINIIESTFGDVADVIDAVREMEILKSTGLTDKEVSKCLENDGCIIYTAEDYIEECKNWMDDDPEHWQCVIDDVKNATKDTHLVYNDGDIVFLDNIKYYVSWFL